MPTRTRIAPSPTGMPHIGTIFQALINYAFAKRQGDKQGQFIVRTEDTDQARKVEGAEAALFDALDWFGLTPDESIQHGGDFGPYRQSERLHIYQEHAQKLIDSGHAYYCFCSSDRLDQVRKQMQADGQPPMYDGHCLALDPKEAENRAKSEPHVVRMKVDKVGEPIVINDHVRGQIKFERAVIDDQVILKSDGFPTYHLAVVVDDQLMNITHVIRGEEWISSAPKHVLLAQYFGWQPKEIIHTPLLRNPDRSKLAKRHGHASVSWYQREGYLPEAILNFLAARVWNHPDGKEIYSLSEFVKLFTFETMHIQAPVVDLAKLDWYNGIYIRELTNNELHTRLQPFAPKQLTDDQLLAIIPHIKDRLVKLSDLPELTSFLYDYQPPATKDLLKKADQQLVTQQLQATIDKLSTITDWTTTNLETAIRKLQEDNDWHRGQFFMMLRLAVTGKTATPPLFETFEVIGSHDSLQRLQSLHDSLHSQ